MLIIIYYIFTISLAIITHYFQMIVIFLIYTSLGFLEGWKYVFLYFLPEREFSFDSEYVIGNLRDKVSSSGKGQ